MTERIERMKKSLKVNKYPLCIEKFRIANETLKKTDGLNQLTRRAEILKNILDNITIFIEQDDMIAGAGASKPFGLEIDYEYGTWTPDEVESLKSEIYTISPEDEKELYALNKSFGSENPNSNLVSAMAKILGEDERLWPFMKSSTILPPWKDKKGGSGGGFAQSGIGLGPGFYLVCVDYALILEKGAKGIINDAKECLKNLRYQEADSIEKKYYWEGVITVYEAWIRFANRYANLAEQMAKSETIAARRAELLEISHICRKVPEHPPETFREAVQMFWFAFLLVSPSPTATIGRFDQYMYPFYKKDIERGLITNDEVLELIENIRIKDMKLNRVSGMANRKKNSGMAKWHNCTIGGVDVNGNDATNELTYLLLESALDTKLPHFTITLRVHEKTPRALLLKAMQVIKTGLGMPALVGDKNYINFFTSNGCTVEDARDYVMTGCLDGNIPARTRTQTVIFFIIPQVLDIFLHNGYCRHSKEMVGIQTGDVTKFKTFEEFMDGFYLQYAFLLGLAAERNAVEMISQRELFPDCFRSALMKDGVECGKDLLNRSFDFDNGSVLCATGGVNVGDSLAVIKKLIYEDKKLTMAQLLEALDADWIGFDEMRKECLKVAKYGNNEDLPDYFVRDVYSFFAKELGKIETPYGGKVIATAISISAHSPGGQGVGASPDGRKGGTILADGSMSPMQGMDKKGPLAVFQSAMKVKQDEYQATLLNMKFHPSALKTNDDLEKLGSAVKAYLTNGGSHVQFNIVDKETLEEAKVEPDKHSDLVVRVAGYSAYFTALTDSVQDEVIKRTAFEQVK
jgi:formate C-acetyltransferase